MKIDDMKINEIGRMLADITLAIKNIERRQDEIRKFLTNPDSLWIERHWKKLSQK